MDFAWSWNFQVFILKAWSGSPFCRGDSHWEVQSCSVKFSSLHNGRSCKLASLWICPNCQNHKTDLPWPSLSPDGGLQLASVQKEGRGVAWTLFCNHRAFKTAMLLQQTGCHCAGEEVLQILPLNCPYCPMTHGAQMDDGWWMHLENSSIFQHIPQHPSAPRCWACGIAGDRFGSGCWNIPRSLHLQSDLRSLAKTESSPIARFAIKF